MDGVVVYLSWPVALLILYLLSNSGGGGDATILLLTFIGIGLAVAMILMAEKFFELPTEQQLLFGTAFLTIGGFTVYYAFSRFDMILDTRRQRKLDANFVAGCKQIKNKEKLEALVKRRSDMGKIKCHKCSWVGRYGDEFTFIKRENEEPVYQCPWCNSETFAKAPPRVPYSS